jgi:serine/threonine-protein kinase
LLEVSVKDRGRTRSTGESPSRTYAGRVLVPMDRYADYVVDGVVGHGGSATVYRAHHVTSPDLPVALKVLHEHLRLPAHLNRLQREFEFASRLKHPHIITMFECGPAWLAMELIGGGGVVELTERSDVLVALGQLASALDYAHDHGIVHCDVKPANILLATDFSARGAILVDFGVARSMAEEACHHLTHVEASLPYSAPEVLRGRPPAAAADEYALACTAVELLTGAPPFTAHTAMALIDDHLNSSVPRYSHRIDWMPRAFDSILAKAMAKDPDLRYGTCSEFVVT